MNKSEKITIGTVVVSAGLALAALASLPIFAAHQLLVVGSGLLISLGGVAFTYRAVRAAPEDPASSQPAQPPSVTALASGGSIIELEDTHSTAEVFAYGTDGSRISSKRGIHDPGGLSSDQGTGTRTGPN